MAGRSRANKRVARRRSDDQKISWSCNVVFSSGRAWVGVDSSVQSPPGPLSCNTAGLENFSFKKSQTVGSTFDNWLHWLARDNCLAWSYADGEIAYSSEGVAWLTIHRTAPVMYPSRKHASCISCLTLLGVVLRPFQKTADWRVVGISA